MLLDLTDAILMEESECYQLLLWRWETDGVEWKIGFLLSSPKTMGAGGEMQCFFWSLPGVRQYYPKGFLLI